MRGPPRSLCMRIAAPGQVIEGHPHQHQRQHIEQHRKYRKSRAVLRIEHSEQGHRPAGGVQAAQCQHDRHGKSHGCAAGQSDVGNQRGAGNAYHVRQHAARQHWPRLGEGAGRHRNDEHRAGAQGGHHPRDRQASPEPMRKQRHHGHAKRDTRHHAQAFALIDASGCRPEKAQPASDAPQD